ncbi:MAG: hypothetical protein HY057_03255 [Rhodospirillales bacterium]|nr:hypothetical protein [Rhodospirillales bacterium]
MTITRWLSVIVAIGMVAGLAACATSPPRPRFPELTYGHFGAFKLDVSRVDIVDEFVSPLKAPNIEHLLPVPPDRTLRRWATDRLAATGAPGRYARFIIQDAKVTETDLPRTPGVRGAFTTDQTQRYDISLAVGLEIRAERGNFRDGFASATATRFRTVPEGITINEREKIWFEMVEAAMNDVNAELERQIRANLPRFLK